jgi:DNA-binding CsgD family transcriptional regulator
VMLSPAGAGPDGVAVDQVAQVDALYWLVYQLCLRWMAEPGTEGALIAVDDAQWSDASTLRLLMRLTLGLEALPITIVVAVRSGEQPPDGLLDRLRYHPDAHVLRPAELSDEAVAVLVRDRLGADAASEFCRACATATGGNPFLVGELAASLRDDGSASTAGAAGRVAGMVPSSVLRSVLLRLARLPAHARSLAQGAAMLGPDAPLRLGAAVAQLSAGDAERAAEALLAAGLLRSADPLLFSHPLVADAVAAEVPQLARSRAHRRAAEQLAADGAANERIAAHLRLTLPGGDPWVVSVLRAAGVRALARGEAADAAILLERALGEPCTAADRSSLLVALSQAYAGSAAPQALESAAEWEEAIDDPRERARALQAMARLLFSRGEARAAVQSAERGRAALGADDQLAGRILASQVACMFFVPGAWPETERLLDELEDGLEAGRWAPEPLLLAQLGTSRGVWGGASADRVRPLAQAMLSVPPDVGEVWQGDPSMAAALVFVGEYELAERMLQRMAEHARRTGSPVYAGMTARWRASLRYNQGWIADAVLDTRQAIDIAALGWSSETAWSASVLAVARLELGDLDGARDAIAIGMAGDHSSLPHGFLLHARGEVALAAGDPDAAFASFTDAGTHLRERYCLTNPAVVPWRTGAATALVALGEWARALELAEIALAEARPTESSLAVGGALRAAAAASRSGQRIEFLREAVAVLAPSGAQLEHMRALCDLGAALRHARQTRASREMLDRAVILARQRGATATARRAQRELRLSGARPSRGPADQQATRLTPGERRVAELAAQDLSNARIAQRLFITLRTVESHLTQTYRKLGIRSRAGLAQALSEDDHAAVVDG